MSTLYPNIRIFDGNNVIPSGHVLTQDWHISYVGVNPPATIPDNADDIDGTDKNWTLLPGLIDAHVHAYLLPGGGSEVFKTAMKCGVTSMLDMHNDPDLVNRLKKECRDSSELSDLKSSYHGATIDWGWPKPIVLVLDPSEENVKRVDKWPKLTPETAEDFVVKNKAQGADYIKLMQENGHCMSFHDLPPASFELQSALVQAARKHGLLTVAHATTLKETMIVLRAGVDGLAHTFCDQSPTPDLIALYKSTGAFVIPTLCNIATINDAERDTTFAFAHDPRITSRKAISAEEISCMSSSQGDCWIWWY
ncbi:hypothetical protein DL98DRAFT_626997 [Cadophora sp. DSE1049]|nr:hypothetical protein DL98DRAFT_626997 [Cadophora sp. DSE1049]